LANAQAELHAFVFELRPEAMREDGLVAALTRHAAGVAAREQLRVSVQGPDERLPVTPAIEEQLYRLCQEALANAVRHAGASEVRIRISLRDRLLITIRDDGRGFDPGIVRPGGFGLRSMRSRAAELGGSVQIRSHPGDGTVVLVEIPLMVAGDG
jgi:signal transduction histidine kinase